MIYHTYIAMTSCLFYYSYIIHHPSSIIHPPSSINILTTLYSIRYWNPYLASIKIQLQIDMSESDTASVAQSMRATAERFCKAFVAGSSPTEMLDKFFASNPKITEHGPRWAQTRLPFLGTTFCGRRPHRQDNTASGTTCDDYYDILASILSFHPTQDTVPPKDEFRVAVNKNADGKWHGTVTVKLHAKFASVKTGKSWEENFIYLLSDFDDDMKIGHLELWADPLSAWIAVVD